MQKQRWLLVLIFLLVVVASVVLARGGLQLGLDLKGGAQLTIQVQPTAEVKNIGLQDLEAVKTVIENRINALGVTEPVIQVLGGDKVLVQLPGVTDPEQAERVLGGTARLEFRQQKPETEGQVRAELTVRQQLEAELASLTKQNQGGSKKAEIAKVRELIEQSNTAIAQFFEPATLTGKNLKSARPNPTLSQSAWEVALEFDEEGGKEFAKLTKNLAGTGRSIGIFLDNAPISTPTVGPEFAANGITGGRAVITGNFTVESANELAVQLRGGSLPFPVAVVENRTVGASLGQDSIRSSIIAALVGLAFVLIFMGVYYRLPGLVADLALLIYAVLTLACYSFIGVTMTLPGIAGFILSIGMAVDANVLIFERTREELRAGNTLYRSVESGFYRAFSSILDSNVTTLIACAALFWLGSGLVKGFALTLAVGVAVSMFTALTCSRTLLLFIVLGFPGVRQKPQLFCPNLP